VKARVQPDGPQDTRSALPDARRAAPGDATRAVLWLIALTALLRLILAGLLGLSVDESYSVAISRELVLSYFDHPPLHVWLVGVWARLLDSEQRLLLRLPDILMFAASTWLMYRLTAAVWGERAGWWAALALNLAPLFTLNAAGGIVPDGLLVLFALLTVQCFTLAIRAPQTSAAALGWWLAAGGAAGLALLSKYTAIFVPLSLGLYLLSCRRAILATAGPWLAALLAAALFAPVVLWNHAHHWVSFSFQAGRARPEGLRLAGAALEVAGQLLYLLPWIALALLYALARALRRGPQDAVAWLFACLAAPALVAFVLIGLWAPVLPHWPAIGWLFTFPLLGRELAALAQERPRLPERCARATAAFLLCLIAVLASQAATGWIERLDPAFATRDPTLDLLDWRSLRERVAGLGNTRRLIATVSWIDAGKADYALGGAVPVLCLSSDPRQFAYLRDARSYAGRDALIVADAGRADWLQRAAPYFQRIEPGEDVVVRRAGRAALTLHTAYGYGLEARDGP
jgi:Dolichyl-phosphate-mannose-protein mannosyltransferase